VTDPGKVDALIGRMRRRRRAAKAVLFAGLFIWVGCLLMLTTGNFDQKTYTIVTIASGVCLGVCGVISIVLAIGNSYVRCPKCDKSFYATGLFVGYLDPTGRKCSNCKFEFKKPKK